MELEFALYGKRVVVHPVNFQNVKNYLSVYKKASAFSKVYEMMPGFWVGARKSIENYVMGERGDRDRYLIVQKDSVVGCGFIELDYSNPDMPEVDIAILEEYRRRGYAFEAAKMLLEHIFGRGTVKCVVWNAFSSNIASRRIAEKLGGIVVERKNLIVEAMQVAGLKTDLLSDDEFPETVTYKILSECR